MSDLNFTLIHPVAVLMQFDNSVNPSGVTYEFRHNFHMTWQNIGSTSQFNITDLPPSSVVTLEGLVAISFLLMPIEKL